MSKTRTAAAIFWAALSLAVPFALCVFFNAPLWVFFIVGAISGGFALITYMMVEG